MRLILSLLLCLQLPFFMMGQLPVANFSASVTSGCSPLGVVFTDQSTGSPKFWNWDFGNGQLSNVQNPGAQTYAAGTYTVTLVVRNANGVNSITKTNLIVSSPSPTVGFTSDKTITCLPAAVQFTDVSVANAGSIVSWDWTFDDLPASTLQNPSHTYTKTGYYGVYLKVTNSNGCSSAQYLGRYIRILNGVKANFDYTGPTTCNPPFVLSYNNLTSGPGNLSYSWDLGNGNTSTLVKPTGIYNSAGTYTVKLKAQSDYGCSDSIQKTFPVNGTTTTFTSPANACIGSPVIFQNTSAPVPAQVVWNFGDGTSSTQLSPSKTYTTAGTYTVTLHSNFGSCSDSASKTIIVNDKPIVNFGSAKSNSCKTPFAVTFQNSSPDVVTANWLFGDGGTSNAATPTVVHTYNTTGSHDVTLTITDSKGCSNSLTRPTFVNIFAPAVKMQNTPVGLCVGQTFSPFPSVSTVDPVISYLWDFGDATTSTAMNPPAHSYGATGFYTVKLTITTQDGCSATDTRTIQVGTPPAVSFTANKTNLCRSDVVTFTNTSSPNGNTVLWDFGDSTTSNQISSTTHKFSDTGFFSVKLKVTSNGCSDSLTKSNFIHALPPLANFGYQVDCLNKTNVSFLDSSATNSVYGAITYLWKFGDPGANTSTAQGNTNFNYPLPLSAYTATLIVNNGACADTVSKPIRLINEKAAFNFNKTPAAYCRNDNVTVTSTNIAANVKKYEWIVDAAAPITGTAAYTGSFGTTGNHTVRLVVTDINGCTDTSAVQQFIISGPTALFGLASKGGCANKLITFSDSSIATGTITKWTYNFGDGVTQSFTAPPFSHMYADTGLYTVKLTITDNIGCQDTYQLPGSILITKPKAVFTAANTVYCPGANLQFADSSLGVALQYAWNFGDGSSGNAQNPSHSYSGNDSLYTVKLFITDTSGCTDSLTRINYISIKKPKPLFSAKDTASLCPPLETKFIFTGKDYESFTWNFGDGSPLSSLDTTNHFYNAYGKYKATLYVTGFGGCIDSASVNINVTNPYANTTVTFNPVTACNELTVNFNITTPASTYFHLFFGDGAVDSSQQLSLQHFYGLPNLYYPSILLLDSSTTTGCQVYFGNFGSIDVKGAVPIFGMDKKKFCDSGTIYFTDYSQDGLDPIITRNWDFGDGSANVSTKDAIHSFLQPGLYIPTLTVTAASGCTKAFTDTVRVLATPTPIIGSADGICKNLIVDFTGSLLVPPDTAITWKWNLGNGQTSALQNVSLMYADSGLYHITLEATNSLGCKGDTSKDIRIYPLPVITVIGDTTLIAGAGGTVMPVSFSTNAMSYNWTPPTNLGCTDCANPFANPKFTTKYRVKVTDVNGCISSRDITLLVVCNNKNFFIPNTFSPNNDGANDRFYPRGTGLDRIQALRIFNRWGELVFEKRNFPANDAPSGWDGTFKGKPASTDTYIYMIDIICENANIITYKGNVTLIR